MNKKQLLKIAAKSAFAVCTLLLLNCGALTPLIFISTAREVITR